MWKKIECPLEYCDECRFVGRDKRDNVLDVLIVWVLVLCLAIDWVSVSVCYDDKFLWVWFVIKVVKCFCWYIWWMFDDW